MNNTSAMYKRGFDNAAVAFAYIPDFATPQEKSDFERGVRDGYAVIDSKVSTQCPACGKSADVPKSLMHSTGKLLSLDIYCDACGCFYNLQVLPGKKTRSFNSNFQKVSAK